MLAGLAQPVSNDEHRLKADPTRPFGLFGAAVAVEEGVLAAFEPGSSLDGPRVLAFEEEVDGWRRSLEITAPDGEGLGFGQALALSGGWLAVGAPESGDGGEVFLYPLRDPAEPVVLRPSAADGTAFGSLLAAHEELLAVAGSSEGRSFVELFTSASEGWRQVARIDSPDGGSSRASAIALSSGWLALGVAGETEGDPGLVHLYRRTSGQWQLTTTLSASGADRFGRSLDLDGDRLLVGAPNVLGPAFARIYVHASGEWLWKVELPLEGDGAGHFGAAVTWTDTGLAVGAPGEAGRGTVHLFSDESGEWRHEAVLRPAPGGEADSFGITLAHAGGTLVVGATGDDRHEPDSGAVYAYRLAEALRMEQEGTR